MAYLEIIARYGSAGVIHNWNSAPTPDSRTDFTTGDFTMPGTLPETPWALMPDDTVGTDMTVAAVTDDTVLTVTSVSGMTDNDKVVVELDSGEWFWSRIDGIAGNDITLLYGIPSAAAIGNRVAVAGQLDGLTTFTLVHDYRAVKASDIIGKSGQLANSFISNTDHNEFQLTNHNLADVAGFLTSAKVPTKFTLETFDGLGYTFTGYDDLNELADLLSEAHSEIVTGQSTLITLVTRAANSQAAMDAITDSRTEPTPSGSGTLQPFVQFDDSDQDTITIPAANGLVLDITNGQLDIDSGDDILINANSNANLVIINDDFVFRTTTPSSAIDIVSPSATGTALVRFRDNGSGQRVDIGYDQDNNLAKFDLAQGTYLLLDGLEHSDQGKILSYKTSSTNGAQADLYIGGRIPVGNVEALPGSEYKRVEGIDSNIYLQAGTALGDDDWHTIAFPRVQTYTSTASIGRDEDYIRIDATAATRVLTLPDASTVPLGKDYKFKLVAKGTGFYGEITPFAGDSIDGSTSTRRLATVGDVFTLRRVGTTSWDIVQSARTVHAEMYMTGGEISQTDISTTAEAVEAWTDNGEDTQGIITSDQANNKFVINHVENSVNGDHYHISANLSYEFDSSQLLELSVYVGGVATGLRTITKGLGFSTDQLNTTVSGDFTATSTGDVEIRIASVAGTNDASWWTGHVDIIRR